MAMDRLTNEKQNSIAIIYVIFFILFPLKLDCDLEKRRGIEVSFVFKFVEYCGGIKL